MFKDLAWLKGEAKVEIESTRVSIVKPEESKLDFKELPERKKISVKIFKKRKIQLDSRG